MRNVRRWFALFAGLWAVVACARGEGALGEVYEQAPLRYSRREATDPVHHWQATLPGGQPLFDVSSEKAYLRSVLAELGVPVESQVLVFSHTSLQNSRISPAKPRALYWNENTYVGWVQGGELEIITTDRVLGFTFYRLKSPLISGGVRSEVVRDNSCLICHASGPDNPYPGLRAFSVFANEEGAQILRGKSLDVDYRTPLRERWGGWYVTGAIEGASHRGNVFEKHGGEPIEALLAGEAKRPPETLAGLFNTEPYLRDRSDVASLMVLEHQIAAHNRLVAAQGRTRTALFRDDSHMAGGPLSEETRRLIDQEVSWLLDAILFKDEVALEGVTISPEDGFARAFASSARRDAKGRSLRDLRFDGRLFEYRCSYLVYSLAFERLPEAFRDQFWTRLDAILTEPEGAGAYPYLGNAERRAIRDILRETHPQAPKSWRVSGG